MLNPFPVKTCVGFRGVDWTVEEKKSQQGVERRKKAHSRRAQRKTQRNMSNEQVKSFLQSVVSPEENAKGNRISLMGHCDIFLELVEKAGVVAFSEGSSNVEKVRLSLEKFDNIKDKPGMLPLIQSWMDIAVDEGLYSSQPEPSSPSSGGSGSTVSGLSGGTLETISLSSQNIADDVAAKIIGAAVFAAYAVGKRRNRSHKTLCTDFSKIFQTKQSEYIDAMAEARKKTEWSDSKGDGENDSPGSGSSAPFNEELTVAYKAFATEANEVSLSETQIDALNKYCFLPLKQA